MNENKPNLNRKLYPNITWNNSPEPVGIDSNKVLQATISPAIIYDENGKAIVGYSITCYGALTYFDCNYKFCISIEEGKQTVDAEIVSKNRQIKINNILKDE